LSRSFKPIANNFVREEIEKNFPDGIDGELMLRDPDATFNDISSAFRKRDGEPDFMFNAFDLVGESLTEEFHVRSGNLHNYLSENPNNRIQMVIQNVIEDMEDLLEFEKDCLERGYEGVMVRDPKSPYKCGRSTVKEGYLLKIKRFVDDEAEVIGLVEKMHNNNEKETSEIGLSKRATKKENMVPVGSLGAFQVRDLKTGVEFEIGTGLGLTLELRKEIWDNKDKYIGEIVKYKHQAQGQKDKPRFPVWLGFRAKEDM